MSRRKGFTQRRITDTEATLRRIEADVARLLNDTLNPCARVGEQQIAVKVINLLRRLRWRVSETYTPLLEPDDSPPPTEIDERQRRLLEVLQEMDADRMWRC